MISTPHGSRSGSSAGPVLPPEQDEHHAFVMRCRLFGLVIVLLFTALISRLWYLQVVNGDDYRISAIANQARRIRSHAPRGAIVDRNGVVLATNRSRFAVYATPEIAKDPDELGRLASMLGTTGDDIKETIHETQQNPYDSLRIALDVPIGTITRIEENRPFLPGVSTEPEPVRWYPLGDLGAHLLGTMGRIDQNEYRDRKAAGYLSDDFLGKTGVEKAYEVYLHGTPGTTDVQIDAKGRRVRTVGADASSPGRTVVLTMDSGVQAAAERVFKEHSFTGAAVAINPQTGAVLSMVSAPEFSPGSFATGIRSADWKPLNSDPRHPLIDRAIDAMYPPGSTFKPVVAAAGLETGSITTHSTAYCPGSYHLGKARFGCWQVHGAVNFYSAMAESCDVFFYMAGQAIGPERIATFAKAFGLAEKTGIDLPGEDIGTIPSPSWKDKKYAKLGPEWSKWYGGDTLHMSIGQGYVLATPLQMARMCAAVGNGGAVLKPYVVDRVVDPQSGAVVFRQKTTVVRQVPVSAANMEAVRQAMLMTTNSGTGKVVKLRQVAVGSKTGSAQVHGQALTHGWFICFAPFDHPTIAIAAVVEHGGHGGSTAGKVARAMLDAYFHLQGGAVESARTD